MKMGKPFIVLMLLLCCLKQGFGKNEYFYSADGNKIYLNQLDSVVIIKFKEGVSLDDIKRNKETYSLKEDDNMINTTFDSPKKHRLFHITKPDKLKEIQKLDKVEYANFAFQSSDMVIQGITNQVLFRMKKSNSISDLLQVKSDYKIDSIVQTSFDSTVYIAFINKALNAFEVARLLFESNTVEYAEPNFERFLKPFTSDPYFNQQWGLQNTGQFNGIIGGQTSMLLQLGILQKVLQTSKLQY
jgi:hypothetical protein